LTKLYVDLSPDGWAGYIRAYDNEIKSDIYRVLSSTLSLNTLEARHTRLYTPDRPIALKGLPKVANSKCAQHMLRI